MGGEVPVLEHEPIFGRVFFPLLGKFRGKNFILANDKVFMDLITFVYQL